MANQATLEQYLIDSVLLDSPVISADPTFYQIKSGLNLVIEQAVKVTGYTVSTLPSELEEYILLLAKKEIYFRLATLTAPEFSMETEFTKLLKGDRWNHYYKLLELTIKELKRLDDEGILSTISVGDVVITGRNGYYRNYRLANAFTGSLTITNITDSSAELTWTKFDASDFAGYDILVGTSAIYDEFLDQPITQENVQSWIKVTDVHRIKYRLTNLSANVLYYVVFKYLHLNGYVDYVTTQFTTLE